MLKIKRLVNTYCHALLYIGMDSDSAKRYRRKDYTLEPMRVQDTPIYKEENKKHRKKSKKRWFIGLIFVLLLAAATSLFIVTKDNSNYKELRKDLNQAQKEVPFPIFIPENLPKGFAYKKNSVSTTGSVILYSLSVNKDKIVSISEQTKPKTANFDDFYNRVLSNKTNVLSTQGKAVLGTGNNQTIGSLVTDKVWILVSTSTDVDNQVLTQLIRSLKPLN
jgi:hypothetical protein